MSRRNHYEGVDLATVIAFVAQPSQGIEEDVYALVPVLISSAYADQYGILGHSVSAHRRSDLAETVSGSPAPDGIFIVIGRSEAVLESVRSDHVNPAAEKLGAFGGSDVAHRGEHISIPGGLLLQGVHCAHAEAFGNLVAVIAHHLVIEFAIVAGEAAPGNRGMGGEGCRYRELRRAEVEHSGSGLPLVELREHPLPHGQVMPAETLHDLSGKVAEHGVGPVVIVARYRIHHILLPESREYGISLAHMRLVVDQHGERRAGDFPSSGPHPYAFFRQGIAPAGEEGLVFPEERSAFGIPHVRTNEDVVVFLHPSLDIQGLGGDNGVNAAHFIANFPAYLKEVIWEDGVQICHLTHLVLDATFRVAFAFAGSAFTAFAFAGSVFTASAFFGLPTFAFTGTASFTAAAALTAFAGLPAFTGFSASAGSSSFAAFTATAGFPAFFPVLAGVFFTAGETVFAAGFSSFLLEAANLTSKTDISSLTLMIKSLKTFI